MSTTPTLPTVVEPSGSELQFFPPKEYTHSYGIDATPDDGYPLRILAAHRDSCRCEYTGDGPLPGMMNEWNRKRAGILDRAIAALGGPVAEPAGSGRRLRALPSAAEACVAAATKLDQQADAATEQQHRSGEYGDWRHDAEVLRMAARILSPNAKPSGGRNDHE